MNQENLNQAQQEAVQQAQEALAKAQAEAQQHVAEEQKEMAQAAAKEHLKTVAGQELNRAVSHALPDEVNQLRWAGLRAVPVIGSIIQWVDNIQWIRNLFGGGKK